jgi:hypothetical protein
MKPSWSIFDYRQLISFRLPLTTHRERTRQGPLDLFMIEGVVGV